MSDIQMTVHFSTVPSDFDNRLKKLSKGKICPTTFSVEGKQVKVSFAPLDSELVFEIPSSVSEEKKRNLGTYEFEVNDGEVVMRVV
jgi:hypothetical protein